MAERMIDLDALIKDYCAKNGCGAVFGQDCKGDNCRVMGVIAEQPTIDAVRVVRCRECRQAASTHGASRVHCYTCYNEHSPCRGRFVEPTFGCLYGERRGGAE